MHDEIGAEYTFAELQQLAPRTVVVLRPEHRPEAATLWFMGLDGGTARFLAGAANMALILFHNAEGDIVDGQSRRIHVHRYLGEV
jgi:hypothetical protein